MPRAPTELLNDVLRCAQDIVDYARDMDMQAFLAIPERDGKTYRAIKNALSEMAEAVKNLPAEIKGRHPSVDWRGLSGIRVIIVHRDHRVDMELVWPMVKEDLLKLIEAVTAELAQAAPRPE
jgi:uncharacterized protein with HEPN domain